MGPLKAVTVFCGSTMGKNPLFQEAAKNLGKCLAEQNIELIYGGGNTGLMGTVAQTALDNGGKVTGFLPEFFTNKNPAFLDSIGKTVIVQDMHTRKRNMLEKADALVALPGGFGTAEELFEMITWRHLGLHNKPIGILNIGGYYDKILDWMKEAMEQEFIQPNASPHPVQVNAISDNCEDILQKLSQCSIELDGIHDFFRSSDEKCFDCKARSNIPFLKIFCKPNMEV